MKTISVIVSAIFVIGCGTTRKEWVERFCSETGGYELGQQDARARKIFDLTYLQKCPADKLEITRQGYLAGYKAAGGKVVNEEEQHQYGQDILKDIVHAIKKNPKNAKTKEENQPAQAPQPQEQPK